MLPLEIQKFKFVIKFLNKIKTRIIFVKNKKSFIPMAEWILLLSQQLLEYCPTFARTRARRRPRHSLFAMSMTL